MIDMHKINANNIDTPAMPPIYVVHAKKWGERETHSYIVTVTLKQDDAMKAADFEEYQRGGKYGCEVSCFNNGEKTIIRKPYNDKPNCYSCEHGRERTGLICQGCKSFSNWSKRT